MNLIYCPLFWPEEDKEEIAEVITIDEPASEHEVRKMASEHQSFDLVGSLMAKL